MTEEEIMHTLENMIKSWNNIREDCKNSDLSKQIEQIEKENKAIQGLLDLYNKQKEEIERLKNAEEYAKLGKETLLDTIHKQQKEIEELKKPKYIMNAETGKITKIHNDFISKDKIRDILLKFQNEYGNEYGEDLEVSPKFFIGKELLQYGEDMIDEIAKALDIKLLEE